MGTIIKNTPLFSKPMWYTRYCTVLYCTVLYCTVLLLNCTVQATCFGFESSEVVPPACCWSRTVPAGAHPRESTNQNMELICRAEDRKSFYICIFIQSVS